MAAPLQQRCQRVAHRPQEPFRRAQDASKVTRHAPTGTSSDQPTEWTNIDFAVADEDVDVLVDAMAQALDEPGWYADLRSDSETVVIFPRQVFRYRRGDATERSEAQEHGRQMGVPEHQLDWPV